MAGTWEGFTDEDIGFFQNDTEESTGKLETKKSLSSFQSSSKKKTVRESIFSSAENEIPENAKLCKNLSEAAPLIQEKQEECEKEAGPAIGGSNPVCLKVIEGKAYELVDRNSADASKATLEVFEARQKMLEEQNKRRKEMLARVISTRMKRKMRLFFKLNETFNQMNDVLAIYELGLLAYQTTEEAKRLQHIQEELQKLDMLLSNDVGILRNKIEEASLEFGEAQKRYNKAEKEFLDAKQNLFVKLEKKELLTKLLCTIIEQNELRKAQKLSELMEKLNINETANAVILVPESQSALNEGK